MSALHQIVFLDADSTFNALLGDVFRKAGFEVNTFEQVDAVREYLSSHEGEVDFVIMEDQLKSITGLAFLQELKEKYADIHYLIVAANLSSEQIRIYIREGVDGIYQKPLNIFALLDRLKALINSGDALPVSSGGAGASWEKEESTLPYEIGAYACVDKISFSFAESLFAQKDFKTSLILQGVEGVDFDAILEDLSNFEYEQPNGFITVSAEDVNEAFLLEVVAAVAGSEAKMTTLGFVDAERLSIEQQQCVYALAKNKGAFAEQEVKVRCVFCVENDFDASYDEGLWDDRFYMLSSSSPLLCPSLQECPGDIPVLAQAYLQQVSRTVAFAEDVLPYLQYEAGVKTHHQLRNMVAKSVDYADEGMIVRSSFLVNEAASRKLNPVDEVLCDLEKDYVEAILLLCEENAGLAEQFLGVSPDQVVGASSQ